MSTTPHPALAEQFDPSRAYRLADGVALRPEPFGALAYHYGTRRLNFLKSHDLVDLVKQLGRFPNVSSALESCAIDKRRRPAFLEALSMLTASGFLEAIDVHTEARGARPR